MESTRFCCVVSKRFQSSLRSSVALLSSKGKLREAIQTDNQETLRVYCTWGIKGLPWGRKPHNPCTHYTESTCALLWVRYICNVWLNFGF